jgi:hypothetical protein
LPTPDESAQYCARVRGEFRMTSTTAFRISVLCGLAVLALSLYGAFQPAAPACGGLAPGYAPIIAFELARSVADLHAIFGAAPGACRTAIAARMDAINWIDSFPFIPLYGAFLVFFLLGLREQGGRLSTIAVAVVIVACIADYAENACLFHLSGAPDSNSIWLAALKWATGVKWVGLGVAAALAGAVFARGGGLGYLAALLCLASFASTALAMADPAKYGPFVSNGVAVGWLVFLIYGLGHAFRRADG